VKTILVMVTTPNKRASEKISRLLLEKKLAACVNRVPGLASRYWWKGRLETAREELLLIKTLRCRWNPLVKVVRKAHPYRVCEILALPVAAGNPPYLKWLASSVRKG
jgi:periplasmic divalent cation tolerance protein